MDDFNWPLLGKLLVIAILTPAWLPVLKELYREVNEALAEEGGVFGKAPTEVEAKQIERKKRIQRTSLISVPLGQEKNPKAASPKPGARGDGRKVAPKRRGF